MVSAVHIQIKLTK